MLMPFQPYRDLDRRPEEMSSQRTARPVPVDAYRRGDELKVELDLPGADPGSIEVTVENDLLSVKATRTAFWDKTDEVQVDERGFGQFGRQLFLGESLDQALLILYLVSPAARWATSNVWRVNGGQSRVW